MSLVIGSVSVGLTATPIPLAANSPGSLVLVWTGANPLTLGGSGVAAGQAGPGQAVIPAGGIVSLAKLGGIPLNSLNGITTVGAGVLSWLYGTEIS